MFAPRTLRHDRSALLWIALGLFCALQFSVGAGTTAPPATSELTPTEVQAIKELFERLADGFKKADSAQMLTLFGTHDQKRREKIRENLERELAQIRYVDFTIAAVTPDETLGHNRHSVDVAMQMVTQDLRRPAADKPDPNSTTETFIVQRLENGTFVLLDSPFFDKLGLQQGMGMVVDALLALMGLLAALAFWVWMGFEVHRARPRSTFWRVVVFVPLIGPLAFFAIKYVPRQIGRDEPAIE
jgi:hypothetical protein